MHNVKITQISNLKLIQSCMSVLHKVQRDTTQLLGSRFTLSSSIARTYFTVKAKSRTRESKIMCYSKGTRCSIGTRACNDSLVWQLLKPLIPTSGCALRLDGTLATWAAATIASRPASCKNKQTFKTIHQHQAIWNSNPG